MKKQHVVDKRKVKLEELMQPGYIPFLAGRPKRSKVIREDDVLNVSIALNTAGSLEEFLKMV